MFKKLFILLIIYGIAIGSLCLMGSKPTSYISVEYPRMNLDFNVPKNVSGVLYYIPILATMGGTALTADGGRRSITPLTKEIGTLSITPLTHTEIKNMFSNNDLKNLYKDFWKEALDEDI